MKAYALSGADQPAAPKNLSRLAEEVAAGTLRVEIQRTFPLADTAGALAAFSGGTRGKIVLTIP